MKRLKEYIEEDAQINEAILTNIIFCLCVCVTVRYSVKLTRKLLGGIRKFWDWVIGDNVSESVSIYDSKFDKSKVLPMQITDQKILDSIFDITKTKKAKKNNDSTGFFKFLELLEEQPELKKLNKPPYYPNYVMFMDAKTDDDKRPNFYGMLGFSLKYWEQVAKKGKDEKIKNIGEEYKDYINIFAVQTNPEFAKQGLLDVYLNNMKKAVKETHKSGLTIKYDNEDLIKVFEKYGFVKIEDIDNYMYLPLKEKKEEK